VSCPWSFDQIRSGLHRSLDPEKVNQLAESMGAIGLQQPITVWSPVDGDCELIAGAHRLQAAVDLGWQWIDAVFHDDWSEIDRQLWEIDENLMRAELSPTEMAEHLAKREELWGQRNTAPTCRDIHGPGQPKGFASDVAEKTGVSKRAVQRATSRAKAIPGDIRAIIKHSKLDTGAYLDSLKSMEPEDQRAKVVADLAEPKKPKPPLADVLDSSDDDAHFEAGKQWWGDASAGVRRRFKAWIQDK